MRSLEKYLDQIYTDFENDVKRMDCLCEIASLNYRTLRLPDYHNIHVQQLYLLKYAYAYAYEYYLMYRKAVESLGILNTVSVVSLGCGAMIDYMGFLSLKDIRPLTVSYTGVDRVDWSYKPVFSPEDQVVLNTNTTAAGYFHSIDALDADIYMFPKSISELSEDEVSDISECFRNKKNKKEHFSVCVSLRNSPAHRGKDLRKTDMLERAVRESGYIPGAENQCYFIIPQDCGIKAYEKNYNYPNRAVDGLKELGSRCRIKHLCECRTQCGEDMSRYPVLKTKEICYKVMTFERRHAA